MTTPRDVALSYAGANVPVFPCREADETTNEFDPETGEIIVLKAKTPRLSNGFKGATLSPRIINILWERNPGSMIGSPTGEQLGAWVLDIDVHKDDDGNIINGYETLAALEEKHGALPATATAKTAGGGEHRFFKHNQGIRNRGGLGRGLDVRSSGGYVVMPGSRTADGREYVWVDYDGEGLPPLAEAPDWLLGLVLPKQAPTICGNYTYTPGENTVYVERAVEAELRELATAQQGGRGEAVNRSAFNLGTLVGAGALSRSEAEHGLYDAAYANGVVAKDGEREIRAKIRRGLDAGIKQPRAIPQPEYQDDGTRDVDITPMVERALAKQKRAAQPVADTPAPEPEPEHEEDEHTLDYKLEAISDLEALTRPGGLVEDIIDWIVSSSEQPCRALALAAALPLVASLAGSRFSTGGRDTRPNIYTVALAESGFGKEHARSQIKRLLMASQGVFERFGGPARIMSASALREVLEENQSVNCQIDEFGGFIRDITDRKAGSHQRAISTDLRDYYSASSTYFEGAAYRGSPPKRIYNPNLCIHGTSTPEQFWSALSSASAEDGLLPRLVLFHVTGSRPDPVKPKRDVRWVPHDILMKMADVAGIDVAKQRGNLAKAKIKVAPFGENKPYVVPWTEDAVGLFASVKESIDERSRKVNPESRPFMQRILENAIKLALIVSVGTNPETPEISEANIEWAATLAWTCAASMLAEVEDRLSDNQREANYKRIAGLIRSAGKKGITRGRLADRLKAIDARQRDEILKDLMAAGKAMEVELETKGRSSKRLVWC
ncbi:bifunctional DNA primase/polymerase [Mesorhizobium retamae]|uniref:Bifunctional DNA primase/polymerase n=1 Tax=Mesorhizobium retamae TaxID=2912854 RepID=A0ABS9QK20_9HYPH|nr:bifunctional DNA primase/polymerase [Mesorhizobium sp. IRAMC:0171]MCG7507081.1 bifunctional DNA primase/polymerase [Mesorhizobium sp. IRAMC:0171]